MAYLGRSTGLLVLCCLFETGNLGELGSLIHGSEHRTVELRWLIGWARDHRGVACVSREQGLGKQKQGWRSGLTGDGARPRRHI